MKIAAIVSRYLLGVVFTVFGLNGFLHFIPAQPMPPEAVQFFTVIVTTHYAVVIFAAQLVGGLLFLANRYVPLALVIIAPVLVNILTFHITMDLAGIGPGAVATLCWFLVFASRRPAFDGILAK